MMCTFLTQSWNLHPACISFLSSVLQLCKHRLYPNASSSEPTQHCCVACTSSQTR